MKKFQLLAKQFDEDALYLWIKDNVKEIKYFLDLRESVLFWYFADRGYDPAVKIYWGDKSEIRESISRLRNYSKQVKEYLALNRKIVQAFKEFNTPKDFKVRYNSSTNQPDDSWDANIRFDYKDIAVVNRQRIKNKITYAKFAIKVLSALLKIKGSKQELQYDDDVVYEYDIYGNLLYKGIYDYSGWSSLEHEGAFLYSRNSLFCKPKYNEKLGVYLIGVSPLYRYSHKVQDERSLAYVYSELDYLVGFAVVRNK